MHHLAAAMKGLLKVNLKPTTKAIRVFQKAVTPAAIRAAIRESKRCGRAQSAADIKSGAAFELREALANNAW
jgi:hypothetical protein